MPVSVRVMFISGGANPPLLLLLTTVIPGVITFPLLPLLLLQSLRLLRSPLIPPSKLRTSLTAGG